MVFYMETHHTLTTGFKQITSIEELAGYFTLADQTLGVFDIDETLLVPDEPAFQKPNVRKYACAQVLREQLPLESQDLLSNLVLTHSASRLIESKAPAFIKALQAQNVRLIALTAAMTRFFGSHYLPKMRFSEHQKHGIDFSPAFPHIHELTLDHMPMCSQGFPAFYSGVLCSNGDHKRQRSASSKGKVLCEFLKATGWIPSVIVFIDDKLYNLEEMQRTLQEFHPEITYHGLHYIGAQSINTTDINESTLLAKWELLRAKVLEV